jgi:RNA polymerase sigma factor (sigma-70 family)
MDPDPDLVLLEAWRSGDKKAADRLLLEYYRLLRGVVSTKVPGEAVDDLVQQIIAAMIERRDAFREGASFRAYVLSIARNTICDFYRKRARRPVEHVAVCDSSVRDLGAGPATMLLQHENQRHLLEALRSLSLDDQMLLELHYWEKLPGRELAQVFEIGEPAIRGRLRRAKERLQSHLEQLSRDHRELAETLTDLDAWAQRLREELRPYLDKPK